MTPSPAARAEAHSQTHLVEQVRDVASRVADVDDHVVVHLAADALDAQARLIEEAREVIESLLEQAVGCAMDHYPGEPEYCEGAHIQDARAFLATLPAKTGGYSPVGEEGGSPTREEMRKVLAAVANAHRLIRGDCPGAAGDVLRDIMQSTSAYQVPATERVDG